MAATEPSQDIRALYSQPPERFVAARTALARQLREDGNRAEAERVARLRRPTRAASAINRAVARWPGKASGLVAAGRELRRSHQNALQSTGDRELLRSAARQERASVQELEDAALQILRAEDKAVSADVERRIRETLEAVALDDHVMERFAAGMLEQEHRASALAPPGLEMKAPPEEAADTRRRNAAARAAEAELRRIRRVVSNREKNVERARIALTRAESELRRMESELMDARAGLEATEREVRRLRGS